MTERQKDQIVQQMLCHEFYLQNFNSKNKAAQYLNITEAQLLEVLSELEDTLSSFIYTMRVEDIKECISKYPQITYGRLTICGRFRSRFHLLWQFFKREHCTPHYWAVGQGLIP